MKHVDNTVSPNTLKALWETALKECPPDGHDFCSAIMERSAEAIRESETGDPNEAAFPDPWIKKQVLILMSTRDYQAALKRAAEAAAALALRLKTNDLKADRTLGLTWPKEKCENSGWGYPCYPSRGRYDDGAFVSVEYSSAFGGFKPGFYIVVAAMESANSQEFVPATLKKARTAYPDAYVKTTPVYMGCMH
jgi:hypothetical protein